MIRREDYRVSISHQYPNGKAYEKIVAIALHLGAMRTVREHETVEQATEDMLRLAHHKLYGEIRTELLNIRSAVMDETMHRRPNTSLELIRKLLSKLNAPEAPQNDSQKTATSAAGPSDT